MATLKSNVRCAICGGDLTFMEADHTMDCLNMKCPGKSKPPFTADLGPIRLPTRDEIMADSRRSRWQPIATVPADREVVIGCYRRVDIGGELKRVWYMRQVLPGEGGDMVVFQHAATHWAEDVCGAPVA